MIQPELFQFLSSFCTYLWETHNSKYILKLHGCSYFYGVGRKCPCQIFFSFFKVKVVISLSSNPSLWKSALQYLIDLCILFHYKNISWRQLPKISVDVPFFADESFKCAPFEKSNQQCTWQSTSKITSELK